MFTGNADCLKYLHSLLLKFPTGVPAKHPMDGDLIKLCIVDHVQGLGLAEYFDQEIEEILAQIYRNQKKESIVTNTVPVKLFKEALAFRLLRMNGHCVNPGGFCWFLKEPEMVAYMEENSEQFISAMYNIYIQRNELSVPWSARLDRLYHRKWIEENKISPLCIGKASFYRISCLDNKKLMQLAVQNFEFSQSIYIQELEELKELVWPYKNLWDLKRKEFLKHVFMDIEEDMPRSCKKVHLYCMKVFQMFFNSANLFDSETALLDDIKKSIYLPIRQPDPNFLNPLPAPVNPNLKKNSGFHAILKRQGVRTSFVKQNYINNSCAAVRQKLQVHMKLNSSFIGLPM